MFDKALLAITKPIVDAVARQASRRGVAANQATITCFGLGMFSALLIIVGFCKLALVALLVGRLCDGLDGAIARHLNQPTDRGAFLDIALDFIFYASVPLAFALVNPTANALAAAVLLFAFIGTGTSFLAYAAIAEKRG